MTSPTVTGRSILIVGGTSGIGLAIAEAAALDGANVTIAGRRGDLAVEAGQRLGGLGLRCDVRDEADCAAVVSATLARWGRLDAVVYAAGISPLGALADTDAAIWTDVLSTVLIGAALVAKAALHPLVESDGRLVVLSSNMVGRPWPGMVPYAASRAALEELVRGLRVEHPALALTLAVVGPTATGFQRRWDPTTGGAYLSRWSAEGFLPPGYVSLTPELVAAEIVRSIASPVRIAHVSIQPSQRQEPAASPGSDHTHG